MAPISASKQKRLEAKVSSPPLSLVSSLPSPSSYGRQVVVVRAKCIDAEYACLPQAAKAASKGESVDSSSRKSSKVSTPLTASANGSTDDLSSMAKLRIATDRSGNGVLTSDPQSRDIHIDSYSLSFHGRLLIENATFSLNYGQRYGLLGENGSGKVRAVLVLTPLKAGWLTLLRSQTTFLESMANRDVEIPEHIDVRLHS